VWKDIQKKYREMIIESFSPLPIYYAPLFEKEVIGIEMLKRMGDEIFEKEDPVERKYSTKIQGVEKKDGGYVFSVYMPFVEKKDLSLNQKGDELIVKVGNVKRNITLPRTLLNYSIKGAKFEDETLKIRFGGENNG
jgi:arsenite-transporting ATPase